MKNLLQFLLSACMVLGIASAGHAQVTTNFNNRSEISERGKFDKAYPARAAFAIAAKDIQALLAQDKAPTNGEARPYKIAEPVAVNIDVVSNASWTSDATFAYGKFTLKASGAKSVSINFDQFYLPKGTALYLYNAKGAMITGPVTESENNANNKWGSWIYKGGELTLDFKTPLATKRDLKLHISNVAYGYKPVFGDEVWDFGSSSACNINIVCPQGNGWDNERNSVALILNSTGSALCSGSLINNATNQNIPYFLTANHCFEADTDVTNWRYTFQAYSCSCTPSQNANGVTFNSSTLRARSSGSDFCLLELAQTPAPVWGLVYAGWSRATSGIQNTTIVHHPAGDVMKISSDNQAPTFDSFNGASVWKLVLDAGATNGGSSGAPYFDQNHRIIAQHFGTSNVNVDPCLNTSKFGGRLDVSWNGGGTSATRLKDWLDPTNTNKTTMDFRRPSAISGPTLLCSTATYTIPNLPAGATVTWSSSNTNFIVIDPVTGFASRPGSGSWSSTITATVNTGSGCTPVVHTLVVNTGTPYLNANLDGGLIGYGSNVNDVCNLVSHSVTASVTGASSLSWQRVAASPTNTSWSQSGNNISFYFFAAGQTATFRLSSSNACGTSSYDFRMRSITCSSDPCNQFVVSPNPSSTRVVIEVPSIPPPCSNPPTNPSLAVENTSATAVKMKIDGVRLFSLDGQVIRNEVYSRETTTTAIDVTGLKKGVYILKVNNGSYIETHRVVVE